MNSPAGSRPAVFVDRDGTLNRAVVRDGKPFAPASIAEFRLFDGVQDACRRLHEAGYVLVVATNQPDVGRGLATQTSIDGMHEKLRELIPEIARIEVSCDPGLEDAPPDRRRKPEPGMLLDAARALNLDLSRSWMIGDRWRDIDCGERAQVRTIFIDLHYSEALRAQPDYTVESFVAAAAIILAHPDCRKLNAVNPTSP